MQYESFNSSGKKVMAMVIVFVHVSNADPDADTRAMTLAPRTFVPRLFKKAIFSFKVEVKVIDLGVI